MISKFPRWTFSYATGVITTAVGLLVLAGWQFDIGLFKSIFPGTVTMKANTAASFLLAGLVLIFLQHSRPTASVLARFCALVITLVGLLTLSQYLFGWNLGIDQILFRETGASIATSHPGRMAPNTALNFVLVGYTLFVVTFQRTRSIFLMGSPIVFSFSIALIGFLGYVSGLEELAGPSAYTRMAVHTAFTFIFLSAGIFFTAYKRMRTSILIEHKLFAGLLVAAAVILFISFLSITGFNSLIGTHVWVEHSHQVKSKLNELLNHVTVVQARARSYVLTGDEKYADQLRATSRTLPGILNDLRLLAIDDPRRQDALTVIDGLLKEQIEFYEQIYRAKKAGEAEAVSLLRTGKGLLLTDKIGVFIEQLVGEEDRRSKKGDEEASEQAIRTVRIIYLSLAVQVLLLALIFLTVHNDLTGRRRAEENLQQLNEELEDRVSQRTVEMRHAHARLERAQRVAHMGFLEWDLKTNSIYWSDEVCRMYGVKPGENMQSLESTVALVHPEDRDFAQKHLEMAVQAVKEYDIDHRIVRSDGKVIWVHAQAELIHGEDGTPVSLLGSVVDITERVQAEEALRESERQLRDAQEMAHLGYWTWDVKTGNVEWSEEVYKIFCLDPNEFTPQIDSILALSPWPEENQRDQELINRAIETHSPGNYEQKFLRPDKSIGYYYSTFQGQYDEDGDLISIVGTLLDITERKRAEDSLRRLSKRLQGLRNIDLAILKALESPEAISQSALPHLRDILHCQRASVGLFDLEKRKVLVMAADVGGETTVQPENILAEEADGDLEILRQGKMVIVGDISKVTSPPAVIRALLAEGIRSSITVPLLTERGLIGALNIGWKDPRTITPEETEIADEVAAQITIAFEHARLIQETNRHAAELEQRVTERTAQLAAANKELEAFAYSVSHDLRAPLRAVQGFTGILLEDYGPSLDDEGKRVCSVIRKNSQKMGQLIDDLLAFSKIGRAGMQHRRIDMKTLVHSVFTELAEPEMRSRITFQLGNIPSANGDPSLIQQVWMNLISNAIKFSAHRQPAVISITCTREKEKLVYRIDDNGAGFDMNYVDKLFGVFQRLHSTKEFEGTGVGLAIVQRIIHRHGGQVWAEGEVDRGASVYFSLPA